MSVVFLILARNKIPYETKENPGDGGHRSQSPVFFQEGNS